MGNNTRKKTYVKWSKRSLTRDFSVQVQVAERIQSKKDYYEILGIEKEADESAIKKAYRKVSMK